ncbi:MAG: DNA methyltransferase [Elusimicrobiota bacterium]
MKKSMDLSWDFRNENTKTYTHCFHSYPAMMIPQIAERLIETYGQKAKLLFDPYCGTGTSLVEANLKNINAIGTDLNPLARLISKVKTTKVNLQNLDLFIRDFNDFIFQIHFNNSRKSLIIPDFNNINFWFKKNIIMDLATVKQYVNNVQDEDIKDFFKVAFSETVREASLTRNGEFKLYRMSEKQIQKFEPDVFGLMFGKLLRNRNGYAKFSEKLCNGAHTDVFDFNSSEKIPDDIIADGNVDIVVTSPPYGDSRTTVAYGQFSRLANQWLDSENANQVDKKLMGGIRVQEIPKFDIKVLDDIIKKIKSKDENRVKDVASFYIDLFSSVNNVSKKVKKNGVVCYVVGNRKVKGTILPTDEIIVKMFELNGFKHIKTSVRNIPNKRMPAKNSPSNELGKLDDTMTQEYIVILKKI